MGCSPSTTRSTAPNAPKELTMEEVTKHASAYSCWVVLDGHVYDVSQFHARHPGGANTITRHAGKDITDLFNSVHPHNKASMQRWLLGPLIP
mmetsp:Transcript_7516/g.13024  ORF Transcript_7516/g.13024 Transcript_7516/m.13024 type:complete len:92 (+) Transcript_7516:124-399(+)